MKYFLNSEYSMELLMAKQYRIVMQPEAYEGMNRAYRYIEQNSATAAHSWAVGLMEAINSLKNFPSRCAPAPENDFYHRGNPNASIRQREKYLSHTLHNLCRYGVHPAYLSWRA